MRSASALHSALFQRGCALNHFLHLLPLRIRFSCLCLGGESAFWCSAPAVCIVLLLCCCCCCCCCVLCQEFVTRTRTLYGPDVGRLRVNFEGRAASKQVARGEQNRKRAQAKFFCNFNSLLCSRRRPPSSACRSRNLPLSFLAVFTTSDIPSSP